MRIVFGTCFLLCFGLHIHAQKNINVLFLGNSYTGTNNLPEMLRQAALSTGDTVQYDSNTPGGYTLGQHFTNTASLSKINAGGWDFVVLQEQSQVPSLPDSYVDANMYPYARKLDSLIGLSNTCAETVFYMTWGRKNGDASNCAAWPPVCTYQGMDSLIHLRYRNMADNNDAILSPVGAVWRYLRANHPNIELYVSDESHPSVAGTYAAVCVFYTVLLRKNPELITFASGLPAATAETIRHAAKVLIYDDLTLWNVGNYDPNAQFSYSVDGGNAFHFYFGNESQRAETYLWNFGDGSTGTDENPEHIYSAEGIYPVKLVAVHCGYADTVTQTVSIGDMGIDDKNDLGSSIFPNPVGDMLYVKYTKPYTEYEIYTMDGRKIRQGKLNAAIPTHDLSGGVYTLILSGDKSSDSKSLRFVKR